jgi:RNA binding exosome subunit
VYPELPEFLGLSIHWQLLVHKTQDEDKQVHTLEKAKGAISNGQSKKHWQLWVHKTQDEDKQAQTLEKAKGAISNGQSKKHWPRVASVSWIVHY